MVLKRASRILLEDAGESEQELPLQTAPRPSLAVCQECLQASRRVLRWSYESDACNLV